MRQTREKPNGWYRKKVQSTAQKVKKVNVGRKERNPMNDLLVIIFKNTVITMHMPTSAIELEEKRGGRKDSW